MKDEKNPFIENFCRALVAKKGEKLTEEALERLIDSLYGLFQNMLGRNMVAALPEESRREFVTKYDKGCRDVDLSQIGQLFDQQIADPEAIMKKTAQEFAALYFKNRQGNGAAPWESE